MSAASIAAPTPVPIAIPRSACVSAAASLTPSPTIPTRWPSPLQPSDLLELAARAHPGEHVLDADRRGDRPCGARVVAGEQLDVDAHAAQPRDRRLRLGLDGVGEGHRADELLRRARSRPPCGRSPPSPRAPTRAGASPPACPGVPTHTLRPSRSARTPRPGIERNSAACASCRPRSCAAATTPAPRGARSRPRRTLRARAPRSGILAGSRPDVGDRQLTGRDRAGLVEHDRVEMLASLEDLGAADQQPEPGAAPGADEDRDGRREPERTGTRDDQHGDRGVDAALQVHRGEHALQAIAREHPGERRERREHEHDGHEDARDLVGEPLDLAAWTPARARRAPRAARARCRRRPRSHAPAARRRRSASRPSAARPTSFSTGSDSPVSIDSSTAEAPAITIPSTGTLSPGRTRNTSPRRTSSTATRRSGALGSSESSRRACVAPSCASSRTARPELAARLRLAPAGDQQRRDDRSRPCRSRAAC